MARGTPIWSSTAVLVAFAAAVFAGCGSGDSGAGGAAASSPASPSPSWSGPPLTRTEADAVSAVARAYWAAYNAYDAAAAIAHLDPGYRPQKADVVRSEVGRIKTFGVQLGVKEKAPPEAVGPGTAQVYLSMDTPAGKRTVLMRFADRDGTWKVTYAEEVE